MTTNTNTNLNAFTSPQKKMYKILTKIEKKGGGGYWMRVGTAFTNKDDSLNLFLDAVPAPNGRQYELHIRELDADDLRKRESFASNGSHNGNGNGLGSGNGHGNGRDLGGIGGGPSTRAVTASSSGGDDIRF